MSWSALPTGPQAAATMLVTTTVHFDGTAGETQLVSVTIKGDTLVESNETFSVLLGTVSNTGATQIAAITTEPRRRHGYQ